MDIGTHVAAIEHEGVVFAEAAEKAGLEASVPSCPGWSVADLVHHLGVIHRWAGAFVRGRTTPVDGALEGDAIWGPRPDDNELFDYYREGHVSLVEAFRSAPHDLDAWYFLEAPSPLAFWARRQAHELAIHRADAQLASRPPDGYDPEFAADGVDELLAGFIGHPQRRSRFEVTDSIQVDTTDVDGHWHLDISPERVVTTRDRRAAGLTIAGPASDVYLFMWNRADPDTIALTGETHLLDAWRSSARIRWR